MKIKKNICLFDNLSASRSIKHFVSTRTGGESEKPFDSLNFSLNVGDEKASVLNNRRKLAKAVGAKPSEFVYLKQPHSSEAAIVNSAQKGRGMKEYADAIGRADAMITKTPNLFLTVQVADCVPILIFDPVKKVVAAVHAGWRGTMKEIAKKTVDKMRQKFECDPGDMIAGIGPSIGPCCFEVGENVYHLANIIYSANEEVVIKRRSKTFVNLWEANKFQLLRAGLEKKNIEVAEICTSCRTDLFYSVRKEGETGRFGAGIMLK